jgi:hypothetical protein
MSITLAGLITAVDAETENIAQRGNASATGNATATAFIIAPPNRKVLSNDHFGCWVDTVADTTGAMDYTTGVYTFPANQDGHAITWEFDHVYWTSTMVTAAINAAITALFPHFYVGTPEIVTIVDGQYEYTLTTPEVEFIKDVQTRSASDGPWVAMKRIKYAPFRDGDHFNLRFYTAPSGYLRVNCISRPSWVSSGTPPATTLNVPDRATDPIVSYACYYLLSQKMAPRMRIDTAVTTTGGGNLSPRQMNDASNGFFLRYQMQIASSKMPPWSSY